MLLSGQRDGDWECEAGLQLKMKGSWVSSCRTLLVLQAQVSRLRATERSCTTHGEVCRLCATERSYTTHGKVCRLCATREKHSGNQREQAVGRKSRATQRHRNHAGCSSEFKNLKEQADTRTCYTRWRLQEWNLRANGILSEKCFSLSGTMSFHLPSAAQTWDGLQVYLEDVGWSNEWNSKI